MVPNGYQDKKEKNMTTTIEQLPPLPPVDGVNVLREIPFELKRARMIKTIIDTKVQKFGYLNVEDVNDSAINPNYSEEERLEAKALQKVIADAWKTGEAINDVDLQVLIDELANWDWKAKVAEVI